jgi:hypothetical protein
MHIIRNACLLQIGLVTGAIAVPGRAAMIYTNDLGTAVLQNALGVETLNAPDSITLAESMSQHRISTGLYSAIRRDERRGECARILNLFSNDLQKKLSRNRVRHRQSLFRQAGSSLPDLQ